MAGSPTLPTVEEYQNNIRLRNIVQKVWAVALVFLLSFQMLLLMAGIIVEHDPLQLGLIFFAIFFFWSGSFSSVYVIHLETVEGTKIPWDPLDLEDPDKSLGNFTVGEVMQIFGEMKGRMNMADDLRLFTVDLFFPNAYADFFRGEVCVDRSWFRMLDGEELRALMAHELMHLKLRFRRLGPYQDLLLVSYGLELGVFFTLAASLLRGLGGLSWHLFVVQGLFLFQLLYVARGFPRKITQEEEWLCDWAGAVHVSPLAAINFQLKNGQRYELNQELQRYFNQLVKEFKIPMDDFPEISSRIDKSMGREHLDPDTAKKSLRALVEQMAKEKAWAKNKDIVLVFTKEEEELDTTGKLDWTRYDTRVRDLSLDQDELELFMQDFLANEDAYLFQTHIDGSQQKKTGSHPSTTLRVLFIYQNWKRLQKNS
jgi:hypothetical protein